MVAALYRLIHPDELRSGMPMKDAHAKYGSL
jgi:hypothetical protein